MTDSILVHEPTIRLAAFASVFLAMALAEVFAPRRAQTVSRAWRWPNNLGIVLVDTAVVRILFPTAVVGFALMVEARGWGLFHLVELPAWIEIVVAVVLLDLAIWAQHVAFHHVPALWRLHRMHHADLELDVTSGLRFHPAEIVLSILVKFAVVAALGIAPVAVLIFEVLLNATSMFSHSNVKLPLALDRIARRVIVTPDMHRIHHSVVRRETDSNYGFNLSIWDRIFGTYREEPEAGQEGMTIGIELFRDPAELRLDRMLLQPLREDRVEKERPAAGE